MQWSKIHQRGRGRGPDDTDRKNRIPPEWIKRELERCRHNRENSLYSVLRPATESTDATNMPGEKPHIKIKLPGRKEIYHLDDLSPNSESMDFLSRDITKMLVVQS